MRKREIQPLSVRPPPRVSGIQSLKPASQRVEIETEEMREIYRALFERSQEGVFICDLRGTLLDANDCALSILGMELEELKRLKVKDLLPRSELPAALAVLRETITEGSQAEIRRFRLRSKDGRDVIVAARAALLMKDGKPDAILGIARDVTEFMNMQDELRRSSSLAAVGTASSRAGHDIRNLLAPMKMLATYVEGIDENTINPAKFAMVKKIARQCVEAFVLIDKLIGEMMALSAPGLKNPDRVDVNPLLIVVTERMFPPLPDPKVSLIMDLCPSPRLIIGDRAQLDRAISNILINAVDAMPEGGRLIIKTENVARHGQDWVKITLRDEGHGMSPEVLDSIFAPYFSTKGSRGTGLGLAITSKTISDHGGGITVASAPGFGTTFELLLPAISA